MDAGHARQNVTHQFEGKRDLGPSAPEFLSTCFQLEPAKMSFALCTATICFLASSTVTFLHRRQLLREPISIRRQYYLRIAYMPPMMSLAAMVALLSPASALFSVGLHKFTEAMGLSTFGMLLFLLLWHESQALRLPEDEEAASPMTGVERVAKALAVQGPKPHFAAPPLCCCFKSCMPKHDFTVRQLSLVFLFVRQYVVLTPLVGMSGLMLMTMFDLQDMFRITQLCRKALMVSNLFCLYGLFVAYLATHELLHSWNTTRKFVAIKVMLILMAYQEFMAERFGPTLLERDGRSCFRRVGFIMEWSEVETRYWCMWLLCLEMLGMSVMLRRAFPPEELRVPILEIHHTIFDMELSRKLRKDREAEDGVAEDLSSSDDENAENSAASSVE